MLTFDALKTPPGDGDILVQPSPREWPELIEHNRRLLDAADFPVLDLSAREVRSRFRRVLLSGAAEGAADAPIVMTGHQPELFHAGVWAKYVVTRRCARRVGGTGVGLVVDHDAARTPALLVPVTSDESAVVRRIDLFDGGPHTPYEHLPTINVETLSSAGRQLDEWLGEANGDTSMSSFLAAAGESADAPDLVDQLIIARRAIDADLDAALPSARTSRVFDGPLVAHLITHADRVAATYNGALADYRRRYKVRGAGRPIPDLRVSPDRIELPLWVYRPGEPRQRLFVGTSGDRMTLWADNDDVGELPRGPLRSWRTAEDALGGLEPWCLRPRALTLTLWARLFACDLFVHGIGGAKYDRITDEWMRRLFGVEPPEMTCVSATVLMGLARRHVDIVALREARATQRAWRYNPERMLGDGDDAGALAAARRRAIEHAIRLRSKTPHDHSARRSAFLAIRESNARLQTLRPRLAVDLAETARRIEAQLAYNDVAGSRAYFYGLVPRPKLVSLIETLPGVEDF